MKNLRIIKQSISSVTVFLRRFFIQFIVYRNCGIPFVFIRRKVLLALVFILIAGVTASAIYWWRVEIIQAAILGDFNKDNLVDWFDFQVIKENFFKYIDQIFYSEVDLDQDGQVTIKDVGIMMGNWKKSYVFFERISAQGKEDEMDQVEVKVKINQPHSFPVKIDYEVNGLGANGVDEGTGQDYVLESGSITFSAGETEKIIKFSVKDDNINEIDEKIEITLKNSPANIELINSTYTYTILDNDRANLVNVKDFGAKGDGVTLDTSSIQQAIQYVKNNGGGVVYFPKGTYLVYNLAVAYNTTLVGEGDKESILKVPDNLTATKPFWHMIWAYSGAGGGIPSGYTYKGDNDSPPLIFQNLFVDANGPNQLGWGSYTYEQDFAIALNASNEKPGRLKVFIENCKIINSISDGITVIKNVDLKVYNTYFSNNFRGSVTGVGGYSKVSIKDCVIDDDENDPVRPISLQNEFSPGEEGYGGSDACDFTVKNVTVNGVIDLLGTTTGSKWFLENVVQPNGSLGIWMIEGYENDEVVIKNCLFQSRGEHQANDFANRLEGGKIEVSNSTFVFNQNWDGSWGGSSYRKNLRGPIQLTPRQNSQVVLENNVFTATQDYIDNYPVILGNSCSLRISPAGPAYGEPAYGAKIVLKNNQYLGKFQNSIVFEDLRGVEIIVDGGIFGTPVRTVINWPEDYSGNHFFVGAFGTPPQDNGKLIFKNINISSGWGFIGIGSLVSEGANHLIDFSQNVVINQFLNKITPYQAQFLDNLNIIGGRIILAPDNVSPLEMNPKPHGFVGDIYRLQNSQEFVCTSPGFRGVGGDNSYQYQGTWIPK